MSDHSTNYCAIYDFELVPYALGDALTWCVQTAIRCREAGRENVDIYICVDRRFPSSIYQRDLVTAENAFLLFNELFGAFATHPLMSSIYIFTERERLIDALTKAARGDSVNTEVLNDYNKVLNSRTNQDALVEYFVKYVYSHEHINAYAASHKGKIPLLEDSQGCVPDIEGVMTHPLGGKRVVVIHPRMRRLDAGYGGNHTYSRDSDYLEWHDFVRKAGETYPEVQFVVVGRLQEKPLELLRMPNVTSLRALGLGLGHDLTLLRRADLFIGTSSGFAAMANFTEVPYFITHMNKESCKAYAIENGAKSLPFAAPNQELIYEKETSELLMSLLERGLKLPARGKPASPLERISDLDVRKFERTRRGYLFPSASTSRFFLDDEYTELETAFLIDPRINGAFDEIALGNHHNAAATLRRINENFPNQKERHLGLQKLEAGTSGWRLFKRLRVKSRRALLTIDKRILPPILRGTVVHRALVGIKHMIEGRERR
jgi:hypothetical protein